MATVDVDTFTNNHTHLVVIVYGLDSCEHDEHTRHGWPLFTFVLMVVV